MSQRTLLIVVFTALVAFVSPVFSAESPEFIEGSTVIDVEKAKELFEQEALFVDVRKNSDWDAGRVPGAVHLELNKVYSEDSLLEEADKTEPVVMYCNGHKCLRSAEAVKLAVAWGFTNVYYFRDGFPSWSAAGMPVE